MWLVESILHQCLNRRPRNQGREESHDHQCHEHAFPDEPIAQCDRAKDYLHSPFIEKPTAHEERAFMPPRRAPQRAPEIFPRQATAMRTSVTPGLKLVGKFVRRLILQKKKGAKTSVATWRMSREIPPKLARLFPRETWSPSPSPTAIATRNPPKIARMPAYCANSSRTQNKHNNEANNGAAAGVLHLLLHLHSVEDLSDQPASVSALMTAAARSFSRFFISSSTPAAQAEPNSTSPQPADTAANQAPFCFMRLTAWVV